MWSASARPARSLSGTSVLTRICESCESSIEHKRSDARFCDRKCKTKASDVRRAADGRAHARDAARYPAEADHRRAYAREYLRLNSERMRAIRRKRKGQIRATQHLVTERDWARLVMRYDGLCAYCRIRPWAHRDHVVPLSRGGSHGIGNLLPACAPCNLTKKSKLLAVWRYRYGAACALSNRRGVIPTL